MMIEDYFDTFETAGLSHMDEAVSKTEVRDAN